MLREGRSSFLFGWKFPPRKTGNGRRDETGVLRSPPGRSLRRRLNICAPSVGLLLIHSMQPPQHPTHPCKCTSDSRERALFITKETGNSLGKPFPGVVRDPLLVMHLFSCPPPSAAAVLQTEFPTADIFKRFLSRCYRHPQLLGPNRSPLFIFLSLLLFGNSPHW